MKTEKEIKEKINKLESIYNDFNEYLDFSTYCSLLLSQINGLKWVLST